MTSLEITLAAAAVLFAAYVTAGHFGELVLVIYAGVFA